MYATCPKSPNHRLFKRKVEVKGPTEEIVDQGLLTIDYTVPQTLYLLRRYTGIWCFTCNTPAKVVIA